MSKKESNPPPPTQAPRQPNIIRRNRFDEGNVNPSPPPRRPSPPPSPPKPKK